MTTIDQDKIKVESILKHIKMVESNMQKLAKKILSEDKDLALKLIKLSREHDLSKFDSVEFAYLNHFIETSGEQFKVALATHHLKNPHHPEHWASIHEMPEEYVAEMVCDCHARAQEFGTNTNYWFTRKMTQFYNFKMTDPVGRMITKYLNLLLEPKFNRRKK
jgi:hypothetical protein